MFQEWCALYHNSAMQSRLVLKEGPNAAVLNEFIDALSLVKLFTMKQDSNTVACEDLEVCFWDQLQGIEDYSELPKLEEDELGDLWKDVIRGVSDTNLAIRHVSTSGISSKAWFIASEDYKPSLNMSLGKLAF